jgi:Protein of unknown function (DUF5131)
VITADALTLAARLKAMGSPKYQHDGDTRTSGPGFGVTLHPDELTAPRRWRRPRRVFVNSMSDLFHPRVPTEFITKVFAVMADTPQHTYQVLTKRPKRARSLLRDLNTPPLQNVWVGVSVEDDGRTDRVAVLRETSAAIRFLSSPSKTKVELWVLFPSGGLLRNLALDDRKPLPGHVAKATSLFGSEAWKRIYQARKAQQIDGQEARERYVNLYRWHLEQDPGYRRAHPIEVKDSRDRPIYHLIFATDSDPGDKIMSHLYGDALTSSPQMREQARRRSPGGERLALLEGPDSAATFRTKAYSYEPAVDPASM